MLFDTDNTMFIVIRCTMFSSKIIVVNGVIIVELLKPVMFMYHLAALFSFHVG